MHAEGMPRQHYGPPAFWLTLSLLCFAAAALYGALWYRRRSNGMTFRNQRYRRAVYGGVSLGIVFLVRAQTLR